MCKMMVVNVALALLITHVICGTYYLNISTGEGEENGDVADLVNIRLYEVNDTANRTSNLFPGNPYPGLFHGHLFHFEEGSSHHFLLEDDQANLTELGAMQVWLPDILGRNDKWYLDSITAWAVNHSDVMAFYHCGCIIRPGVRYRKTLLPAPYHLPPVNLSEIEIELTPEPDLSAFF